MNGEITEERFFSRNKFDHLIYWRTPWKTATVFSILVILELSTLYCSIISVVAYTSLCVLIYGASMQLLIYVCGDKIRDNILMQPMQVMLQMDMTFSSTQSEKLSQTFVRHVNRVMIFLQDAFLIKNYVETVKLGIFLYFLTYVGAYFNFLTLVIIATFITFTVPKVYETFKVQIDDVLTQLKVKIVLAWDTLKQKIVQVPILAKMMERIDGSSTSPDRNTSAAALKQNGFASKLQTENNSEATATGSGEDGSDYEY